MSNTSNIDRVEELELIRSKHYSNCRDLLKAVRIYPKDSEMALREKRRVKRQTLQLMHRALELERGVDV